MGSHGIGSTKHQFTTIANIKKQIESTITYSGKPKRVLDLKSTSKCSHFEKLEFSFCSTHYSTLEM